MVSLIRYALFREADVDGSGEVTFDEFQIVVRKKLNLAPAEMPEARLRALWCALDADNSNAIRVDELAKLDARELHNRGTQRLAEGDLAGAEIKEGSDREDLVAVEEHDGHWHRCRVARGAADPYGHGRLGALAERIGDSVPVDLATLSSDERMTIDHEGSGAD
jgi:hypothetical protein